MADGMDNGAGFTMQDAPAPDMTVLRLNRRPPPTLPLDVFGPRWRQWIETTAQAAAAPAAGRRARRAAGTPAEAV